MQRGKKGSIKDLAQAFILISTFMILSTPKIQSTNPSGLSMVKQCLKSLTSMIVILLHLLARVLRNAECGFPIVSSILQSLHHGHQPIYFIRLNQMLLLGILVDNQVILLLSFYLEFISSVVSLAIISECVLKIMQPPPSNPKQVIGHGKPPSKSPKAKSHPADHSCVNHVSVEEAQEATDVVLGTLPFYSISALVLFNSGASHSFISQSFASLHDIPFSMLPTPLLMHAPGSIIILLC